MLVEEYWIKCKECANIISNPFIEIKSICRLDSIVRRFD